MHSDSESEFYLYSFLDLFYPKAGTTYGFHKLIHAYDIVHLLTLIYEAQFLQYVSIAC